MPEEAFRTALVNRLRAARSYPLLTVVAPAGYGKSILLQQWASRDDRPFAWASPDDVDEVWAGDGNPAIAVVDDAHRLDGDGAAAVARAIATAPSGSTVVLSGRSLPPGLSLARLRASGRLLELGAGDLALTRREARALVKAARSATDVACLLEQTEGWAAGIVHAIETGQADGNGLTAAFFRSECLAQLTPAQRAFLRQTSVLERLSGPLCDAMLEADGSAEELDELDRLGLFLVPLDHRGEWYRYHHLLRAVLAQELAAEEPELAADLHRRAADWLEAHGDPDGAVEEAFRAGQQGRFVELFGTSGIDAYDAGHDRAVEDWLARLDDPALLRKNPRAAIVAARLHAHRGRLADAERCLCATVRGIPRDDRATRARFALVDAAMCTGGAETMLRDAQRAVGHLARDDRWYPYGLFVQGVATALEGDEERANAILGRAVHAAERLGAAETLMLALAERALLSGNGASLSCEAARAGGIESYPTFALTLALSAQEHLRHGNWADAQAACARARALLPRLTAALPWLAVQARIELASAHVMLRDADSARTLLGEIDAVFRVRRELGNLRARRNALAREIRAIPPRRTGQTARLTGAELRLLPLLGTHLSFREIGTRLYLSRHTVKTQAISAYRKLGASSRREAVVHAAQLGLIDPGELASTP